MVKSEIDLLDVADIGIVQNIAALTEDSGEGSEKVQHVFKTPFFWFVVDSLQIKCDRIMNNAKIRYKNIEMKRFNNCAGYQYPASPVQKAAYLRVMYKFT